MHGFGRRFEGLRRLPRQGILSFLVPLVALASCGLAGEAPDGGLDAPVPDRGVAPWHAQPLQVCLDDLCDSSVAALVEGADLRRQEDRWLVVAAVDGSIFEGELSSDYVLRLAGPSILAPQEAWQSAGLSDPDWVETATGALIVYGLRDGSAVGSATLGPEGWQHTTTPLLTSSTLGAERIDAPSALKWEGGVALALALDRRTIGVGRAVSLAATASIAPVLDCESAVSGSWRSLTSVGDPDLVLTSDGLMGLFFSSQGELAGSSPESTPIGDASISFAASSDGESFATFSGNPVYDHVSSYILHAAESHASVAYAAGTGLMLYRETSSSGTRLSLAMHDPL